MNFFGDLLESLGLRRRSAHVGMRPYRSVELALGFAAAYDRALEGLDRVLGANVYRDDRPGGTIEAGFGTLNAERIRLTLEAVDATHTRVRIEAHYPAGTARPPKSLAVETLADALSSRA